MRYTNLLLAILGLAAMVALGAGCGSDEATDETATPPATETAVNPPAGAETEPAQDGEDESEAPMVPPASHEPGTEPAVDDSQEPAEEPEGEAIVIRGTVEIASDVPEPGSMPYQDCLTYVKYSVDDVVSGELAGPEALVVLWGMQENELQPPAEFAPGDRHELKLVPLEEMPELSSVAAADDTEEYSLT
ncbi:MAG: hypothetical protein GF320_10030, partial [Armatimonadia bacterium]|nr:hypothetical protein [Armatimonadia bacterium]